MWVIFFALCFSRGGAVIYHLNDSEYAQMPPLSRLDDYESCLRDPAGLYCVAKLDLYAEPGNQLMHMIKEYSAVVVRHYNHSYIERGLCVSAPCSQYVGALNSTAGLSGALAACVDAKLHQYGVRATLSRLYYCDTPHDNNVPPVDELDWAVAAGFALVVGSCLLATIYDYWANNKVAKQDSGNKYILCFSVIRNWQLVGFENKDPKLNTLKGLHGVRTITNILMILAHVFNLIAVGFTKNTHDLEKTYDNLVFLLLFNGMMIVQVFFSMSGFLLVYNLLLRSETTGISWRTIPYVMILRWWRLIPAYAATLAFSATWIRFLSSGPLWNLYITAMTSDCRKYWWHHMLFINNYVPDDKHCLLHTWHLGADTQMFFIGLLVYSTTKHTTRKVVLALLLVLSVVLPALHVWIQDLDGVMLMTPEFYRTMLSENFHYMHVLGHNNMSALVVGMISAYLAYDWQKKGVNISRNKVLNTLSWLVVPGVTAMFYSGYSFYGEGERASLLVRVLYGSLHRLVISMIVAVAFIGIAMKSESKFMDILNWRGWVVPSRLSYCVYLLHYTLVYILHGSRAQLNSVSYQYLFLSHLSITVVSYVLALPLFLVVEAPMNRLIKAILEEAPVMKKINGEVTKNHEIGRIPQKEAIKDTKRPHYSSQGTLSRRRRGFGDLHN